MKMTSAIAAMVFLLLSAVPPVCAEQDGSIPDTVDAAEPAGIPSALIPQGEYEFEPVLEGVDVVHEFIIENVGTATLEIERIKTGCGCTTANFTRTIPPGGQGSITIKVNTRGYGGQVFKRQMTVFTNDPQNPTLPLMMTGKVDVFAGIIPASALLKGMADDTVEVLVSIMPDKKYPFHVIDSVMDESLNGKIEYHLEKFENGYVLVKIKNSLHEAGQYRGRILLKTDHPVRPEITIPVVGKIG